MSRFWSSVLTLGPRFFMLLDTGMLLYNVGHVEDSLALLWEKYKAFYVCLFSTHVILKLTLCIIPIINK